MTTEPTADVQSARAELTLTLNAIEDKLNVPRRAKRAIRVFREDHPLAFAAAGVASAAAVGAAVWFGVAALRRR